jgi:hypothetical protein
MFPPLLHNIYNLRLLPWQQLLEGRYLGVGKPMPVWSEVEENACGCPWKTHAPHEQNDQNNVWKQSREVYNLKHILYPGPVTKLIYCRLKHENDCEHVIGIQNYWVSALCPSSGIVITRKQCFGNWICFRSQVRVGRHQLCGVS